MTFVIKSQQTRAACGMWKFRKDKVSQQKLITLANAWVIESGGRYTHLIIRDCSKDQHGIQFSYPLMPGEHYSDFFEEKTHELKREFGNHFVGWDVAPEAHVIV